VIGYCSGSRYGAVVRIDPTRLDREAETLFILAVE
jgi:hypothetical protein